MYNILNFHIGAIQYLHRLQVSSHFKVSSHEGNIARPMLDAKYRIFHNHATEQCRVSRALKIIIQ